MTREQVDNIKWVKRYEVDMKYHHGAVYTAEGMPYVRMVQMRDLYGEKTHYLVEMLYVKTHNDLYDALKNI